MVVRVLEGWMAKGSLKRWLYIATVSFLGIISPDRVCPVSDKKC
jgi:hypothetical protein